MFLLSNFPRIFLSRANQPPWSQIADRSDHIFPSLGHFLSFVLGFLEFFYMLLFLLPRFEVKRQIDARSAGRLVETWPRTNRGHAPALGLDCPLVPSATTSSNRVAWRGIVIRDFDAARFNVTR